MSKEPETAPCTDEECSAFGGMKHHHEEGWGVMSDGDSRKPMSGTTPAANDDAAAPHAAISLTDLAAALGIDEDEAIERIGDLLLRRDSNGKP